MKKAPEKKTKAAVVVTAIDGLVWQVSGVGTVVANFFRTFDQVKKQSTWFDSRDVQLIALAPDFEQSSQYVDGARREEVERICRENNGFMDVFPSPVSPAKNEDELWAGNKDVTTLDQWRGLSLGLAAYLKSLARQFDEILVFAHDAPFCFTRAYLSDRKVRLVWMSHGLGKLFDDKNKPNRTLAEGFGFPRFLFNGDFFAYIGEYYAETLKENYNIPGDNLLPFINEVFETKRECRPPSPSPSHCEILQKIEGKRIILSWGRCAYQKGFDFVLPGVRAFLDQTEGQNCCAVLLMPTGTGDPAYQHKIKAVSSQLADPRLICLFEYDEILPQILMKSVDLEVIVFGSRFEGFSLACLEALDQTGDQVRFVHSPIPPFFEVFNGVNGAVCLDDFSPEAVRKSLATCFASEPLMQARPRRSTLASSYVLGFDRLASLTAE